MIKVGVIGATGYVGEELVRLLLNHPGVELTAISSHSFSGEKISSIYNNLYMESDLICETEHDVIEKADLIFTALPHGLSELIAEKCINAGKKCIDMGADFRLYNENVFKEWYGSNFKIGKELHEKAVYGLPELKREKIKKAELIANPGCYATSIELALFPLVKNNLIDNKNIICDSKSGVTGAGRGLTLTSHYPECNESLSPYKIASHRHTPEIEQILGEMGNQEYQITFTPHLLPINRGIMSTIYCNLDENIDLSKVHELYSKFYDGEPFVKVLPLGETAAIRNVKLSNYCNISLHIDKRSHKLIIISVIDNMIKGAAGQAVQNMNLMLGLNEKEGLGFIPSPF